MKRLITGTVYVLVLFGFFALRVYFDEPLFFDLLILFFTMMGTFEMCRAFGDRIDSFQKAIVGIFSAGIIVSYCVSESVYTYLQNGTAKQLSDFSSGITFVVFMMGAMLLLSLLVFRHEKTSLESAGYSFLAYLYPSVFLLALSGVNHMPIYSEAGVLFVFVLSPFADCFAYLFGKYLGKKFPKKMAPHVSPNKTVVGGIGGLIGGAVGAVVLFYGCHLLVNVWGVPLGDGHIFKNSLNLIFFIGLGVLTAAFAEVGDLAESAIKRKLGIKDMGKLLPGHGGILDRIDSSLYASLIVYFVLMVLQFMIAG